MFYIVESSKSFYEACVDLEPVVQRLGFVVLKVDEIGAGGRHRGLEFDDECKVFEIANDRLSEKLLAAGMCFSLAAPWRISVFTDNGTTRIGVLRPTGIIARLGAQAGLAGLAREIEDKLLQIVDESR